MIIKFDVWSSEDNQEAALKIHKEFVFNRNYSHNKRKSSTTSPIKTKMITVDTDTKELTTDDHYVLNTVRKELFIRVKQEVI